MKRRTFARQLIMIFVIIFVLIIFIFTSIISYYFGDILTTKIEDSFQQTLNQTAINLEYALSNYEESLNRLLTDKDFVWNMKELNENHESEADETLESTINEFFLYSPEFRIASIQTVNGEIFSYDRVKNPSIYKKVIEIHEDYLKSNEKNSRQEIKGVWTSTKYLDRIGTEEYYVYTIAKSIYDWTTHQYLGRCLISIEEDTLANICKKAMISGDSRINDVFIIDQDQIIVSHHNKEFIGTYLDINEENHTVRLDGAIFTVFRASFSSNEWTAISILNNEYLYNNMRQIKEVLILISSVVLILTILLIYTVSMQLTKPVKRVIHTMNEVKRGNLEVRVEIKDKECEEIALIAEHFNTMMEKINKHIEMVKIAGVREKDAEIRALEAQINPHFIYNTLDTINWLAIENEQMEISEMLSQFAQILRYQIKESNILVTLEEELTYLNKYLFLQKKRFMDSFEYIVECPEGLRKCKIYKMIFQPFVENSIIHGCADLNYAGLLKIQISKYGDGHIQFLISDNGCGMDGEQIEQLFVKRTAINSSIGVLNVLARLDTYYGSGYQIFVESELDKGTVIRIVIPIIKG